MMLTVYNLKKEVLYTGTKQDCMHFIKRHKYNRDEISISTPPRRKHLPEDAPIIETTAPIESKPKGFFSRLFDT